MLIGIPKEIKTTKIGSVSTSWRTQLGGQAIDFGGNQRWTWFWLCGWRLAKTRQPSLPLLQKLGQLELVVKEGTPSPVSLLPSREDLLLFTYLHMAAASSWVGQMPWSLLRQSVAYETVRDLKGQLPLLVPMWVRLLDGWKMGAHFLTKQEGGSGVLLGKFWCSQRKSHHYRRWGRWNPCSLYRFGPGAQVTILDISAKRLSVLEDVFGHQSKPSYPTYLTLKPANCDADVATGAVLIPGAKSPKLVTDDMVKQCPGSDRRRCSWPVVGLLRQQTATTHTEPVYEKHVLHMPLPIFQLSLIHALPTHPSLCGSFIDKFHNIAPDEGFHAKLSRPHH